MATSLVREKMKGIIATNEPWRINFCTFGMFIIDEIEWTTPNPQQPKYDLIGGAGTYAVLGARLAAGRELSETISWIVDVGLDFPDSVKATFESWNTACIFRYDQGRKTTRAWNGYGAYDHRDFKYLTPKIRLEVSSLNIEQLSSNSFHMVCSPERCKSITGDLKKARQPLDSQLPPPVIVWEPIPDVCSPDELQNLQEAALDCTLVSPNHEELKMFFNEGKDAGQEELVMRLMGWSSDGGMRQLNLSSKPPNLIVREGANGSTMYIFSSTLIEKPIRFHLRAYHTASESYRVVDPTGGGNTYLGAMAICLTAATAQSLSSAAIRENLPLENLPPDVVTWLIAMIYATVAASFAIEQNGVPVLSSTNRNQMLASNSKGDLEKWNNISFASRIRAYVDRERTYIGEQVETWFPKFG